MMDEYTAEDVMRAEDDRPVTRTCLTWHTENHVRINRENTRQAEINRANDPYQQLANAVIVKAANDYWKALNKLKKRKNNTLARIMKEDCEEFFMSDYYKLLTKLDGEVLMERLKKVAGYDG